MELVAIIVAVVIAIIFVGKLIGAPDPKRMTDEQIIRRIRLESAWIEKYWRQPISTQDSANLKSKYFEKRQYIAMLEAELASRNTPNLNTSLQAIEKELGPILEKIDTIRRAGASDGAAVKQALEEYFDEYGNRKPADETAIHLSTGKDAKESAKKPEEGPPSRKFDFDIKSDRIAALKRNALHVANTTDSEYIDRGQLGKLFHFIHFSNEDSELIDAFNAVKKCGGSQAQIEKIIDYFASYKDNGDDLRVVMHEAAVTAGDKAIGRFPLSDPRSLKFSLAPDRVQYLIWALLYSDYKPKAPANGIDAGAIDKLVRFIELGGEAVPIMHTIGAFKTANATNEQLLKIVLSLSSVIQEGRSLGLNSAAMAIKASA